MLSRTYRTQKAEETSTMWRRRQVEDQGTFLLTITCIITASGRSPRTDLDLDHNLHRSESQAVSMSKPSTPGGTASNTLLLRRQLTELTKHPVEGFSAGRLAAPFFCSSLNNPSKQGLWTTIICMNGKSLSSGMYSSSSAMSCLTSLKDPQTLFSSRSCLVFASVPLTRLNTAKVDSSRLG